MSVMLPKIRLCEDQLLDLVGASVILAAAERAQDGHWLVGDELMLDRRFTFEDGESDELSAATIESHVYCVDLPLHRRHRPIERRDFYYVMQHVAPAPTKARIILQPVSNVKAQPSITDLPHSSRSLNHAAT